MNKNIQVIDVGSENNESPKEVEETKQEERESVALLREPINNIEDSKEVEINNIINDEENK